MGLPTLYVAQFSHAAPIGNALPLTLQFAQPVENIIAYLCGDDVHSLRAANVTVDWAALEKGRLARVSTVAAYTTSTALLTLSSCLGHHLPRTPTCCLRCLPSTTVTRLVSTKERACGLTLRIALIKPSTAAGGLDLVSMTWKQPDTHRLSEGDGPHTAESHI